jgi:hypothetical protein
LVSRIVTPRRWARSASQSRGRSPGTLRQARNVLSVPFGQGGAITTRAVPGANSFPCIHDALYRGRDAGHGDFRPPTALTRTPRNTWENLASGSECVDRARHQNEPIWSPCTNRCRSPWRFAGNSCPPRTGPEPDRIAPFERCAAPDDHRARYRPSCGQEGTASKPTHMCHLRLYRVP